MTFAILCACVCLEVVTVAGAWPSVAGRPSLAVSTAAVACSARRHVAAAVLFAAAPLVACATGWEPTATWSMAVFGVLFLTVRGAPSWPVGVSVAAATSTAGWWWTGTLVVSQDPTAAIAGAAALAAAWSGASVRVRRQYRLQLERTLAATRSGREAAVRQGVAEERLRIAREVHDGLGHRITVVSVHLAAAEAHLGRDQDQVAGSLASARDAVRAVLRETQEVLGVLRLEGDAATPGPAPGCDQLADLVADFRAAGLELEARLPDRLPDRIPPRTGAAAFRIAQESLTNARRHGSGTASLTVTVEGDLLVVEAVNAVSVISPGARRRHRSDPTGSGGGHGLVGMEERARLAGGRIQVFQEDGLFWTRAELPLGSPAR